MEHCDWTVFIAAHQDPARVGERRSVEAGATLFFGSREIGFGPLGRELGDIGAVRAVLDHAPQGRLHLHGLADGPSLDVNGASVRTRDIVDGDLWVAGPVALMFQRQSSPAAPAGAGALARSSVPESAHRLAHMHAGEPIAIAPAGICTLVSVPWPEGEIQLERSIVHALKEHDSGVLAIPRDLPAWQVESPGTGREACAVRLRESGFVAGEQWVSLQHRPTLARVYEALVRERARAPGRALDVHELLRRAWPGERVLPRAGANRVYVALTTLRKLGLRHSIRRCSQGYFLDPTTPFEGSALRTG